MSIPSGETMSRLVVIQGPQLGLSYPLSEQETLGSAEGNSIRIDDRRVMEQQAIVVQRDGSHVLLNVQPERPVVVDGTTITERILLHGDMVTIGSVILMFDEQPELNSVPAAGAGAADSPGDEFPERLLGLLKHTRELSGQLDSDEVVRQLAEAALGLLRCTSAAVVLKERDEAELRVVYAIGMEGNVPHPDALVETNGLVAVALDRRLTLLMPADEASLPVETRARWQPDGTPGSSLLIAPVAAEPASGDRAEGSRGGLVVAGRRDGGDFGEEDRQLSECLAGHAAIALKNAAAFERATVDPRSGLLFRQSFLAHLDDEIGRANRAGASITVLMIGTRGNSSWVLPLDPGTPAAVLTRLGEIIRNTLRRGDVATHFSTHVFAVLLPGPEPHTAQQIAGRIREKLTSWTNAGPAAARETTVRYGLAVFRDGDTSKRLLRRANAALHLAFARETQGIEMVDDS